MTCCGNLVLNQTSSDAGLGMADMGKFDTQDDSDCQLKTSQNSTEFDFSQITCQEGNDANEKRFSLASFGLRLGAPIGIMGFILAIILWTKRRKTRSESQQGLL